MRHERDAKEIENSCISAPEEILRIKILKKILIVRQNSSDVQRCQISLENIFDISIREKHEKHKLSLSRLVLLDVTNI